MTEAEQLLDELVKHDHWRTYFEESRVWRCSDCGMVLKGDSAPHYDGCVWPRIHEILDRARASEHI